MIEKARKYVTDKADYESNGYDVFCECWGTEEWNEAIADFPVWSDLKEHVDTLASIWDDRQADAINSAF